MNDDTYLKLRKVANELGLLIDQGCYPSAIEILNDLVKAERTRVLGVVKGVLESERVEYLIGDFGDPEINVYTVMADIKQQLEGEG